MKNELLQLLISLKLGDGCFVTQCKKELKTYSVITNSINVDYIYFKKKTLLEGNIQVSDIKKCTSGYCASSNIIGIRSLVNQDVSTVGRMSIEQAINLLDMDGLIMLYLDDGSLHKTKNFMHLYCNSFTEEQTNLLIEKIYSFFPLKKCKLHYEKKKDGRKFPFIYIPVSVSKQFSPLVRNFLIKNNICSLLYKSITPSQTIESIDNQELHTY